MQIQTHSSTEDHTGLEPASDAPIAHVEHAETRPQMVRVVAAVDIYENAEELLLKADLPGVRADAVELGVDKGVLSLVATHTELCRVYRRSFVLPDTVDTNSVDAGLADGVLTVRLAKREDSKPRRIEVRAAG